ncbi:hypothetical protein V8C34DRAFT_297978 [Trichoderma compactum]
MQTFRLMILIVAFSPPTTETPSWPLKQILCDKLKGRDNLDENKKGDVSSAIALITCHLSLFGPAATSSHRQPQNRDASHQPQFVSQPQYAPDKLPRLSQGLVFLSVKHQPSQAKTDTLSALLYTNRIQLHSADDLTKSTAIQLSRMPIMSLQDISFSALRPSRHHRTSS